jgi:hypothetical protein
MFYQRLPLRNNGFNFRFAKCLHRKYFPASSFLGIPLGFSNRQIKADILQNGINVQKKALNFKTASFCAAIIQPA